MRRLIYLIALTLGALCVSCNDALSPKEYAAWVEDKGHGLTVTKEEAKYLFTLTYKPIEYIVAMQLRQDEIPDSVLKKEVENKKGMQYYTFSLTTTDGKPVFSGNDLNFPEKSIYLLSGMQNDIALLEGTDTLHCKLFHFEDSNGMLPYDNCVLGFDNTNSIKKDKTFLYKADKLGMEWVKITIKASDINRIPKLETI